MTIKLPPSIIQTSAISVIAFFAATISVCATGIHSGSISGIFSNPVLSGIDIDVNGNPVPLDNTTTAVDTGFGTNSITWGNPFPISSALTFTGNSFNGVAPGQVFDLGTIAYTNGTSAAQTLIFGATLTLSVDPTAGGPIGPAVSHLGIMTTANGGVSKFRDADFISFDVFPVTFNVFEGSTATADLFGTIVGDPALTITGIELDSGQSNNGFIGHGQPSLPDSGDTFVLMGMAFGALALFQTLMHRNIWNCFAQR